MSGFLTFYHVYECLGEDCRKRVLRNIFEFSDVSIYDLSIRNSSIVFRFFINGVFYQYVFLLDCVEDDFFIKVICSRRIFNCLVNVDLKEHWNCLDSFSLFLNVIRCQDEYQVYRMMKYLL